MKDFLKINEKIDQRQIELIKENISKMKETGNYPERFEYPVTLQFEVTGRCNLLCKHCYNRSGDDDRNNDEYTVMTPEKWCNLAREIVADGGIFQCIISGGEPLLLGKKLFDIMDILHDDGTSFVMITNGYLLTAEIAERLKKYRFYWFQVSIDGVTSIVHDAFRGVDGSWERAVRGALEISSRGIPLVIAHSVTPQNLCDIDEMVELSYQLGAGQIIMGEILPSGRAVRNSEYILSDEQRNLLYNKIEELQKLYIGKLEIRRSSSLKNQMQRYELENNLGGIIRPNGDFRLDCMAPFVIGNVLKTPIKELWLTKGITAWQSDKVKSFINSISENRNCGNIVNHVDADILI